MGIQDRMKAAAFKIVLEQVLRSPRKRLPELLSMWEKRHGGDLYRRIGTSRPELEAYALRLLEATDPAIVRRIAEAYLYRQGAKPQGTLLPPSLPAAALRRVVETGAAYGNRIYLFAADAGWGDGKPIRELAAAYPAAFFVVFCREAVPAALVNAADNVFFAFASTAAKEDMALLRRRRQPFVFCRPAPGDPAEREGFIAKMAAQGACCGLFLSDEAVREKPFQPGRTIPVFYPASVLEIRESLRPRYWRLENGDWRQRKRGNFEVRDFFPSGEA